MGRPRTSPIDLTKFFPCGDPRTQSNFSKRSDGSFRCKKCTRQLSRERKRIKAYNRCLQRGHTRKVAKTRAGKDFCKVCASMIGKSGGAANRKKLLENPTPRGTDGRFVQQG